MGSNFGIVGAKINTFSPNETRHLSPVRGRSGDGTKGGQRKNKRAKNKRRKKERKKKKSVFFLYDNDATERKKMTTRGAADDFPIPSTTPSSPSPGGF